MYSKTVQYTHRVRVCVRVVLRYALRTIAAAATAVSAALAVAVAVVRSSFCDTLIFYISLSIFHSSFLPLSPSISVQSIHLLVYFLRVHRIVVALCGVVLCVFFLLLFSSSFFCLVLPVFSIFFFFYVMPLFQTQRQNNQTIYASTHTLTQNIAYKTHFVIHPRARTHACVRTKRPDHNVQFPYCHLPEHNNIGPKKVSLSLCADNNNNNTSYDHNGNIYD